MPVSHVSMISGKPAAYRQAIFAAVYQALVDVMQVPEDDQFMTLTEHPKENFRYGNAFGIQRSDDLIFVQITIFNTRPLEQKKALYRRLVDFLVQAPGLRPEDVFINIYDTPKENWSVGLGEMQFGAGQPSHA